MEFYKERVYTALNAEELKTGDKVIVADTLEGLKYRVKTNERIDELYDIADEGEEKRFLISLNVLNKPSAATSWYLAYLIERKENCTMCKKNHLLPNGCESLNPFCVDEEEKKTLWCRDFVRAEPIEHNCVNCGKASCGHSGVKGLEERTCENWQGKKKYRPFKNREELIETWLQVGGKWQKRELTRPFIWVRDKEKNNEFLLSEFPISDDWLDYLYRRCTFLDGTPCGVMVEVSNV